MSLPTLTSRNPTGAAKQEKLIHRVSPKKSFSANLGVLGSAEILSAVKMTALRFSTITMEKV